MRRSSRVIILCTSLLTQAFGLEVSAFEETTAGGASKCSLAPHPLHRRERVSYEIMFEYFPAEPGPAANEGESESAWFELRTHTFSPSCEMAPWVTRHFVSLQNGQVIWFDVGLGRPNDDSCTGTIWIENMEGRRAESTPLDMSGKIRGRFQTVELPDEEGAIWIEAHASNS